MLQCASPQSRQLRYMYSVQMAAYTDREQFIRQQSDVWILNSEEGKVNVPVDYLTETEVVIEPCWQTHIFPVPPVFKVELGSFPKYRSRNEVLKLSHRAGLFSLKHCHQPHQNWILIQMVMTYKKGSKERYHLVWVHQVNIIVSKNILMSKYPFND